jgi:hypothetical protein
MERIDQRRHPRQRINGLSAVAQGDSASAPVTAVIDLSEGGACLEWSLPDDVAVGTPVRLRFVLAAGQSIEIGARVVRIAAGRAGVAFLPAQQEQVRQLLAEARASD